MREDLARVGIRTLDDLALRRLGSAATLTPMLQALGAPVNSDYFPYVELMAPKSRFLKSAARELPQLSLFPLPQIEMLGGKDARWQPGSLTPVKLARYTKVAEALALRSALLGAGPTEPRAQERVAKWKSQLGDCTALDRDAGLAAVHEAALATLAFLDAESLRLLWHQPAWLPCSSERWPPAVRQRLDLYRAIAERDGTAMLAAARASLESASGAVDWRRYALHTGLLGARSIGDDAAVQQLWQRHGTALYADGKYTPELIVLLTMR